MKLTLTVAMDTDRDRDVIAWLDAQPNRSAAIRDMLRRGLAVEQVYPATIDDVLAEIRALGRRLDSLMNVRNGEHEPDEPPDVAAALNNLGL